MLRLDRFSDRIVDGLWLIVAAEDDDAVVPVVAVVDIDDKDRPLIVVAWTWLSIGDIEGDGELLRLLAILDRGLGWPDLLRLWLSTISSLFSSKFTSSLSSSLPPECIEFRFIIPSPGELIYGRSKKSTNKPNQ